MQGTRESNGSTTATTTTNAAAIPFIGLGLGPKPMTGEKERKGATARKKLPSPKEMVAHYESQGMQSQEACFKVIDDLQNLLLRVVATKKSTDFDTINANVRRLESKLDSKPGYSQTLAIGVVSGAVVRVFPHVAGSFAEIWNSVRSSTST